MNAIHTNICRAIFISLVYFYICILKSDSCGPRTILSKSTASDLSPTKKAYKLF